MTPLTIHRNLLDAIEVLYAPFIPCNTPAEQKRNNAVRYLKAQLAVIETPIAEDTAGDCAECGAELLDVTTHDGWDCPASPDFPWPNESQRIGLPN